MTRTPVIIDTDPGVDDVLAILLALASPELEILGFVVSYGNTDVESSFKNVLKIYDVLARHFERVPDDKARFVNYLPEGRKPFVVRGPCGPLEGDLHSAQYFHGRDGLGEISERHADLTTGAFHEGSTDHPCLEFSEKTGCDVALDVIRSRPPRSVTYIVLGPMTNLALMMQREPDVVRQRLGRVVCMGGALDVPGNTSPVAEFNFFADPFAVKQLLTPDKPEHGLSLDRFVLLPLDITTAHEFRFSRYIEAVDPSFISTKQPSDPKAKLPLPHFTSSFLERTREIMLAFGKDAVELHDIVAVWCAAANPPVADENEKSGLPVLQEGWKSVRRRFQVERTGEFTRGMLVIDRRDDDSAYDLGANRAETQAQLELTVAPAILTEPQPAAHVVAAPVQVKNPEDIHGHHSEAGVACIFQTPGGETLVRLMLQNIWGST